MWKMTPFVPSMWQTFMSCTRASRDFARFSSFAVAKFTRYTPWTNAGPIPFSSARALYASTSSSLYSLRRQA